MAPLLRLDSTGENSNPITRHCTPKEDSVGEPSQCRMKNLKNYLHLGDLWESAINFGGACMSTKQNLISSRSSPVSCELMNDKDNLEAECDLDTSKMCDSTKRENIYNTAARFCQGFGFGCKNKNYSTFSNCYKNHSPLNSHTQDMSMDLFKNFHKKTCRPQSQMTNEAMRKQNSRPSFYCGDSNQLDKNMDSKRFNGYCSSPGTDRNWRERLPPRSNRSLERSSDCVYNQKKTTENMNTNSTGNCAKPNLSGMLDTPTNDAKLECKPKETDNRVKLCSSRGETLSRKPESNDCDVQLDWFTYGDTGYETVGMSDATERKFEKHRDLLSPIEIDYCYSIDPIESPRILLPTEPERTTENEETVHSKSGVLGSTKPPNHADRKMTVLEATNCDKPNFDSHSKPFHCSNISKSNGAKDHSYILSLRTNNKKNRPSAKKRRQRKAREQDIGCSPKSESTEDLRENAELEFGQKCESSALAFILGVGLESASQGHAFYVSLSDGDDPDFSDDDYPDNCDNGWESDEDSLCLFNFNCVGSTLIRELQQPPQNCRISGYNRSWGIGDGICNDQAERTRKVNFNLKNICPTNSYVTLYSDIITA